MISTIRHATRVIRQHLSHATEAQRSPHWPAVEHAFRKGHPTCAACGGVSRLQVHHMRPFHLHPELELEPTNLIVLCMAKGCDAHLLIGHGDDFHAYNPNVLIDAARVRATPADRSIVETMAKTSRLFE